MNFSIDRMRVTIAPTTGSGMRVSAVANFSITPMRIKNREHTCHINLLLTYVIFFQIYATV